MELKLGNWDKIFNSANPKFEEKFGTMFFLQTSLINRKLLFWNIFILYLTETSFFVVVESKILINLLSL